MPNEFVGAVTQADGLQHLLLEKLGNSFLGKLQPAKSVLASAAGTYNGRSDAPAPVDG